MSEFAETEAEPTERPGPVTLFLAFAGIAAVGFGGVLPWARRMLVEERRWLTGEEFTEVLSLAQFLPGGNIVNLGVVVGQRFGGPVGATAAVAGLLAAPVGIVIAMASLYVRFGDLAAVHRLLDGVAAAAVGLIISMAAKIAAPLVVARAAGPIAFAVLTFAAVGLIRIPLPLAILVLAPASIAFAAWRHR